MSMTGLAQWLESPQGRYVMAWEQACCDRLVADIFGYNAVLVGGVDVDLLRQNRMPFRFRCAEGGTVAVMAEASALPFASASVDLVVLPHVLEFSPNPHRVLREVERVLVPEGSVIVLGFNPLSSWGLRRLAGRGRGPFPWSGRYLSVGRLKDWLALLGFEAGETEFGCHVPPVQQQQWLDRWCLLDRAARRWWPFLGGVYALQGIKRVAGMRLILPAWRDRRAEAKAKALSPVAQRRGKTAQRNKEMNHG